MKADAPFLLVIKFACVLSSNWEELLKLDENTYILSHRQAILKRSLHALPHDGKRVIQLRRFYFRSGTETEMYFMWCVNLPFLRTVPQACRFTLNSNATSRGIN